MLVGKPGKESRTEVGRRARIRLFVGLKGYKQHGQNKNLSNHNK
jgi:hypothetical protein